jgi:ribosomal protein S7
LADEIINAAKGSSNSYAIKKKVRLLMTIAVIFDFHTITCFMSCSILLADYFPSNASLTPPFFSFQDELERVAKSNR